MSTAECPDQPNDLGRDNDWALLIWYLPISILVAGLLSLWIYPNTTGWLWGIAFIWGGAACMANAVYCKRKHCFYTAPLFTLLGASAIAKALDLLSFNWYWLWIIFFAGTSLTYLTEISGGKYYGK